MSEWAQAEAHHDARRRSQNFSVCAHCDCAGRVVPCMLLLLFSTYKEGGDRMGMRLVRSRWRCSWHSNAWLPQMQMGVLYDLLRSIQRARGGTRPRRRRKASGSGSFATPHLDVVSPTTRGVLLLSCLACHICRLLKGSTRIPRLATMHLRCAPNLHIHMAEPGRQVS
jgi:ribosomal protein L44E